MVSTVLYGYHHSRWHKYCTKQVSVYNHFVYRNFLSLGHKGFGDLIPDKCDTRGDFSSANGAAPFIMAGIKVAVTAK